MLKKLFAIVIVVCCASVASAGEIGKGQTFLSLGGGASLPYSDFKDAAETGFLGGVGFEYWISPKASIGIEANSHKFGFSAASIAVVEAVAGIPIPAGVSLDWNVVQVSAVGKYLLSYASTAPYVKYTFGTYKLSATISGGGSSFTVSDDSSDLGVGGGLGFQFGGSGKIGGFVEGTYHNVFVEGGGFSFLDLRGGINFKMGGGY